MEAPGSRPAARTLGPAGTRRECPRPAVRPPPAGRIFESASFGRRSRTRPGKKSVRNRLKASRDVGLGSTSAWILVRGLEARGDWGCVEVGEQQGGEEERRRGVDHHHRQVGSG